MSFEELDIECLIREKVCYHCPHLFECDNSIENCKTGELKKGFEDYGKEK